MGLHRFATDLAVGHFSYLLIRWLSSFLVVPACKYNLKSPSYTFSSPGYPSNYPSVTDCQYHFKVANGRSIRLSFNFISLQSSPSCREASIQIYESGTLKETICGASQASKTWLSTGNEVFMTFQANSTTSSKGFYGSFSPVLKRKFLQIGVDFSQHTPFMLLVGVRKSLSSSLEYLYIFSLCNDNTH